MFRSDLGGGVTDLIYEPSKAGVVQDDGQRNAPIYALDGSGGNDFNTIASKVGTIFVYVSRENKFNPLE